MAWAVDLNWPIRLKGETFLHGEERGPLCPFPSDVNKKAYSPVVTSSRFKWNKPHDGVESVEGRTEIWREAGPRDIIVSLNQQF